MKILLISPKGTYLSRTKELNKFWSESDYTAEYRKFWSGVGIGLLIVGALTSPSYEVEFIDENIEEADFSKNYDIVGITGMTQQATRAYQIADKFRTKNIKVVIGGIHATLMPEEAKNYADSVVVGEAEYVWPQILKDFENKQLKPFYKNENLVDLRESPIPRLVRTTP
ncbi:MAG: hypothetical protein CV087_16380 [Candidatus Brocadia sp. WS118]|nr:MAG: hypothetical protein CV087_16380 [Candidatus Brocadia sp. WS118]